MVKYSNNLLLLRTGWNKVMRLNCAVISQPLSSSCVCVMYMSVFMYGMAHRNCLCFPLLVPWSHWQCSNQRSCLSSVCVWIFKQWSTVNVHWHFLLFEMWLEYFGCIGIALYKLLSVAPDRGFCIVRSAMNQVCHVCMHQVLFVSA